jgi:hypothetical protein
MDFTVILVCLTLLGNNNICVPRRCLSILLNGNRSNTNRTFTRAISFDFDYFLTKVNLILQGPLPDTAGHFWLMVWEQKSTAILMLNRIIEKGQVRKFLHF